MGKKKSEKPLDEKARVDKLPKVLKFLFKDGGFEERKIANHTDANGSWCFVSDIIGSEHYHQYQKEDFNRAFGEARQLGLQNEYGFSFKLQTINDQPAVLYVEADLSANNKPKPESSVTKETNTEAEALITASVSDMQLENDETGEWEDSSKKKKTKKNKNKTGSSVVEESNNESGKNCARKVASDESLKDDDMKVSSSKKRKEQNNQNQNDKTSKSAASGSKKGTSTSAQKYESEDMDTSVPMKSVSATEVNEPSKKKKDSAPTNETGKPTTQPSKIQNAKKTDSESKRKESQSTSNDASASKSTSGELTEKETLKLSRTLAYALEKTGAKEKEVTIREDGSYGLKELLEKCNAGDFTEEQVIQYISTANKSEYWCSKTDGLWTIRYIEQKKPETASGAATGNSPLKNAAQASSSRDIQGSEPRDYDYGGRKNLNGSNNNKPYKQKPRESQADFQLSKTMSYLLRHGANKAQMPIGDDGYMLVIDLLRYRDFGGKFNEEDVQRVVANNDKKRFELSRDESGRLKVRANQGHTLEVKELELTKVTDAGEIPKVIHGTYLKHWPAIKKQGLNKMDRNHIHFSRGEPGDDDVISGMRSSCEIMIYIDVEKAMRDGYQFFISANGVILCPGNEAGILPPEYIAEVIQRKPRMKLL